MDITTLPFRSNLEEYQKQAGALLERFRSGDVDAIRVIKEHHPRFLRSDVPWLPRDLPDSELRSATLDTADAQLTIARWYDFQDWSALAEYVEAVTQENSPVSKFESAVEAVITGDVATLVSLPQANPAL